jgi:hypothetical protein
MTETLIKEYLQYLNKAENQDGKKELFEETKKVSIQIALNKIPNLQNEKKILW